MYSGDDLKYAQAKQLPCTCDLVLTVVFGHIDSLSLTLYSSGACEVKPPKWTGDTIWPSLLWLCVLPLAGTEHKLA